MNQGRIWCVVNPTVGLPLFLGSVAAISFIVHGEVLSHTTWFSGYWQGSAKAKMAESLNNTNTGLASATATSPAFAVNVAPVQNDGKTTTAFMVTVTPNGGTPQVATVDTSAPPGKLALAR